MKRLLAVLLSLTLLAALLPVSAVAEEAEGIPAEADVALYADEVGITGVYTTWESATVLPIGETAGFTLSSYDSSYTAAQVWFAVTVEEDGQAIQMSFADMTKSTYVYLYDGAVLQGGSPSSGNYCKLYGAFSSDTTYSWKAPHAGVYYLMLRPYNSSNTATVEAKLTCTLLEGDLNESNDAWQDAYELAQNVNTYYNLNGSNDVDWFKITTTVPGEAIKLVFSNFDYTVSGISAYLYSGETLSSGSTTALGSKTNFKTDATYSYKVNEPGDYYVKVIPYSATGYVSKNLKLRYEIVPGDAYEVNDSYSTATAMPDVYDMEFTLNGINDEDWFYFETETENELINLYFSGFETDYSNKITYYVYDTSLTGYNSSAVTSASIYMTHSKALTFANTGGHYIRVILNGTTPVENTLKLRLERGVIDDYEPNETWLTAAVMMENTPVKFNLPSTADVDCFKFTVDEPNMTVELTLTIPSGGGVGYYLYSGSDLITSGDSAGSIDNTYWSSSGTKTVRYMLGDAGDYYVKLVPWGSKIFDEDATITYDLIGPDAHERNNTWKTATVLNEGITESYTFPADNDADWFKFTADDPNMTVELTLTIPSGGGVSYYLYSGSDFITSGDSAGSIDNTYWSSSGTKTARYMLGDAGDYYVKLVPWGSYIFDEDATVTYDLIGPDAHERNNTWKTATVLNEGITESYTLPADNDADWFKFTADDPNMTVELTLTIPSGGGVSYYLYSGSDFITSGDSAGSIDNTYWTGSGTKTARYMLGDAGDYYVKLVPWGSYIFDADATVTYDLIGPDANERNNSFGSATELPAQAIAYYTLPADNDTDWFKLDTVTVGDQITATIGNVQSGSSTIYCALYVVQTGETSTTSCGQKTISQSTAVSSYTWTASYEGDYYLRMSTGGWCDNTMYLRYTITQDDVDVTGVSIGNGDSTIFEGKTLQLYANIVPGNAANQAVTWQSSNPAAATIDENGLVTGVAPGTTTITVTTADGGYTARTTVTVAQAIPVTGVSISCGDPQPVYGAETNPRPMALDTSLQFTASIQPETATELAVVWSVSDESVLQVTKYGKVYAVGSGRAKVTATTVDGGYTADFWINVPDESYPVRSISLNLHAATIYMGEDGVDLTAVVSPTYATNPGVIWSSDNEAVATVDPNGHVTPVSVGYATITVQAQENRAITAACQISVQPVRTRVTGITFDNDEVDVGLYGTVTLQPVIAPANATDQSVTWTSDNKTVATVSRNGVVTALNIGQATITATTADGSFTASVLIRVSSTASLGDINNDGISDAGDALLVLRCSVGLIKLTEAQEAVADVNGDGFIDAGDAILILRYDAGLISEFPAEEK